MTRKISRSSPALSPFAPASIPTMSSEFAIGLAAVSGLMAAVATAALALVI